MLKKVGKLARLVGSSSEARLRAACLRRNSSPGLAQRAEEQAGSRVRGKMPACYGSQGVLQ